MKAEKIRGVDVQDLERQVQDAQEQLFRLRFQMGMGQFEGLKKYRTLKKDRARMLTILSEKRGTVGTNRENSAIVQGAADAVGKGKRKR